MKRSETLATGLGFLEGPVWREATGDLTVTVVDRGMVLQVDVASGRVQRLADTEGGPNGAYPCHDGGLLITQNGGVDWDAVGITPPSPSKPTTPGLQKVGSDGTVHRLTRPSDGPFQAPNDLCVSDDQTLWFTDPPPFPAPPEPVGRVWRWPVDGHPEVFADRFLYCNGIGVDPEGALVVVEGHGLMRLDPDGERSWLVESLPSGGDGFAFDTDGNVYVAGGRAITVVSPEGRIIDQLEAPEGPAIMTNCCFGGEDRRTLFATEGRSGRILAFLSMPSPGVPLPAADR